jgi:hypothetical protein
MGPYKSLTGTGHFRQTAFPSYSVSNWVYPSRVGPKFGVRVGTKIIPYKRVRVLSKILGGSYSLGRFSRDRLGVR